MDELVRVGGRRSCDFSFDDLACGILQADDGLDRAALVPPKQHDRADYQQRSDQEAYEGVCQPRAESLARCFGKVVGHVSPQNSTNRQSQVRAA